MPMEDKNRVEWLAKRKKTTEKNNLAPFQRFKGITDRVMIYRLPTDTTEEEVRNLVKKEAQIEPVRVRSMPNYRRKTVMFDVICKDVKEAITVVDKLNKSAYKDVKLLVQYGKPAAKSPPRDNLRGIATEVRVAGLSAEATPDEITAVMHKHCPRPDGSTIFPVEVVLVTTRAGYMVGLAKIGLSTPEEATIVREGLDGKEIHGDIVDVDYWEPSQSLKEKNAKAQAESQQKVQEQQKAQVQQKAKPQQAAKTQQKAKPQQKAKAQQKAQAQEETEEVIEIDE
jgi:RNA recognition motif-containing protein